ncbi:unnamed protein product [Candidula unifasciata]|uniref:RanBP2-type domain-containing protein n=1 Tax=Candidula unifasciata TaxID=100452 RepID=A0A8S3Z2S8_9EUPU|nr:unnamed protein product [Candidula unifasciata]
MEAIQQARKLFLKCHIHQTSLKDSDKQQLGRDIQRFISIAIKEATSKDLFENTLILEMLKAALKQQAQKELPDVMPLARAFQGLEKYFFLLVEQPWKAELKEIKMYGGFYRTRIKSVLPDCESIFEHAGYMVLHDSCTMVHRGQVNKNFLLLLAFDCRVGQVVCETIAEHYNKVKGLSMSMEDAIGNILRDEYSRDKLAPKYAYPQGNGLIMNTSLNSHVAPPALPKREPTGNSSNMRYNVAYESDVVYSNSSANVFDKTGIAFPPKSPCRTSDLYLSVLAQSPVTPVNPDRFTYLDVLGKENLRNLPQGTSDDHMIESLRHLNMKDIPRPQGIDSWKQFSGYGGDSRIGTASNQLSLANPASFSVSGSQQSGAAPAQSNFKPAPSIDEGIEQDLSTSKVYPHSAKYTSMGGHQVVPSKHSASHQQVSFDQGYRTVTPESIYSPCSAGFLQTVYHPPSVAADCPGAHSNSLVARHNAPPPIPSRALKPKSVKDEEAVLQSKMYPSVPQYFSQPPGVSHLQREVVLSRPPLSAPGYSTLPRCYNVEPVLRRERLMLGKTNSLNPIDPPSVPLPHPSASGRTVRSMDMTSTHWECQSCRTLNVASSICFACSASRLGPEVISPTTGETKLSCSSCTFANSLDKTHCEMCGSKLPGRFTLV